MPCNCQLGVNEVTIDGDLEGSPLGTLVHMRGDSNLVIKLISEK